MLEQVKQRRPRTHGILCAMSLTPRCRREKMAEFQVTVYETGTETPRITLYVCTQCCVVVKQAAQAKGYGVEISRLREH